MTQATFERSICYHYPYVAPASILSTDPIDSEDASSLRADASEDGTCYLEVTRSFYDGTYQARVAAHPDLIRTQGYTVVLNAAHLAQARPNDCRVPGSVTSNTLEQEVMGSLEALHQRRSLCRHVLRPS